MQTKLTLRVDDALIKRAKNYSEKSGKSLSQIVADYFNTLTSEGHEHYEPSAPITKSLRGILRDAKLDEEDYHHHIEEKHG